MAKKTKTSEAAKAPKEQVPAPTPRLLERYEKEILPALAKKLGRANPHALPRLEKIVVNMGVGTAITEKKHIDDAVGRPDADHRPEAAGDHAAAWRSPTSSCARTCRSAAR